MKSENILPEKAMAFAVRICNLCTYLTKKGNDQIISRQLFRSGTSIGANIAEALRGESDADFVHKLKIARKEASESMYWLELLLKAGYLEERESLSMQIDCEELLKLLTSTIKTMENKILSDNRPQ